MPALPALLPNLAAVTSSKMPPSQMKPGLASILPPPPPDMTAVMAAKAKIESLMQQSGAMPPASSSTAPPPNAATSEQAAKQAAIAAAVATATAMSSAGASAAAGAATSAVSPTWFTEVNLPALLSRCKYPKVADALHEMQTNRAKRRSAPPLPPIPDAILAAMAGQDLTEFDMRRELFMQEVKDLNNRHRLLTDKLGDGETVYKVPDDIWERYFSVFMIDVVEGRPKLTCSIEIIFSGCHFTIQEWKHLDQTNRLGLAIRCG